MKKFIDEEGFEHNSYEDYCNSPMLDTDLIYLFLANGKRTPQNEKEERWKKEADSMRAKGQYFELPFN